MIKTMFKKIKSKLRRLRVVAIAGVMTLSILAAGGCALPGLEPSVSREGIVIASGNTTERQIMAGSSWTDDSTLYAGSGHFNGQ